LVRSRRAITAATITRATILHLLGIDDAQLTFKYQGRHYRLTDVHGHVVNEILA